MPITYCRDCVFCVAGPDPAANTGECVRHPPTIISVGGAVEQWRPHMQIAEDRCGDGEAKEGPPKDHLTLRKWRHNAGLTQTELARRLGVSRATASSWEDSGKSIPLRRWKAIAAACGVTTT